MARVVLHPSGKSVECPDGETVLTALEKAGYALSNNCRAGACGECKVKVLNGQFDQGVVLDMALTPEERRQGYGLMCMAKPISEEMMIDWGTLDALPKLFPPREDALFVVVDKRMIAARVAELHLRPVGQALRFWPGQYVTLGDAYADVPARPYSISNAPRPDGEIALQIAREDGITSRWIHETLRVGVSVKISGAYGAFIGDPSVETPVLCLAAGTGLAPLLALAEAALRRGFKHRVNLILSARTRADVYGTGMMAWWQTKHRNFDYTITLTRERAEGFSHGRIDAILPGLYPDLSKHSVFIAGSPAFVDACLAVARTLGAPEKAIHKERFFTQQELALVDPSPAISA
ncbi:2Fe-2S iron-sulfur cluster binding domain-containing protein [bacterium]|nr:MAG: 2Fe-2S iron-sulfur cluster binding domain-containing protein [bacterium]